MVTLQTKSQFKARSVANNVDIYIPVPADVDSPSFKASIGTVTYLPDLDCVKWTIKQFYGQREFLMRAHFGLPSVSGGAQLQLVVMVVMMMMMMAVVVVVPCRGDGVMEGEAH